MSVPLYQVLSFLWYSYNLSNYKVTQYKILVWLCGVQSISDMSGSGISTLLLPPPLLNNILNFKVIFQPPLITSPSPQRRINRNQCRVCRVSVVFLIKMKSIMLASSQLSLHQIVFGCLDVLLALLAKIQTSIWCSSLLLQNIEWCSWWWWIISPVSPYTNQGPPDLSVNLCLEAM